MEDITNKELHIQALDAAKELSDLGPDIVFSMQLTEKKRLYYLVIEAFRSFSAFCILIKKNFLVQSSSILRMFVEQMSKIVILYEHPEIYDTFVKHCKVREEVLDMSQKERKRKVIEVFDLNENQYTNALSYLDYGWIKSLNKDGKYGYHEMLNLSCMENTTILKWVDHMDQFIHQNVNSLSIDYAGFEQMKYEYIHFSLICFDKFYVSFHNLIVEKYPTYGLMPKNSLMKQGDTIFENKFSPIYDKTLLDSERVH